MKNLELVSTIIEETIISDFTIDEDDFSDLCADNEINYNEAHKYAESLGYEFV